MENFWDGIEKGILRWKDVEGLILVLIIESFIFSKFFHALSALNLYYLQWWALPAAFIITIFVWCLITVRLCIIDGWNLLAWVLVAGGLSVANYFILPILLPKLSRNVFFFTSIGLFVFALFMILFSLKRNSITCVFHKEQGFT